VPKAASKTKLGHYPSFRCSCGSLMIFPTEHGDGTPYELRDGDRRRIMCDNKVCPRFGVRYLEPSFPVAETD
jgi:hypothetical protein